MIQLISLWQPAGTLFWSRLSGDWGRGEWAHLQALLTQLPLHPGSRVVLDLSGTHHMDFRAAAQLIAVAQRLQSRGAQIVVTGLSDYLVKIV
jgi:anti-anti-sigma regulatory factor